MAQPTDRRPTTGAHHARRHGNDGRRSGVEANARLTATTAVVLLVLLAVEGVTVLRIGSLLRLHVIVGLLLVPPVLLKMGSTGWRFARYYLGDPAYKEKGPPHPILRVLGPFVVILTVLLFASGIALLLAPSSWHSRLLLVHRASFFVWLAAMAIHVIGHLLETARLAPLDWKPRTRRRVSGANTRQLTVLVSLGVGAGLAAALVGHVTTYLNRGGRFHP
jgi:hypothetical protein